MDWNDLRYVLAVARDGTLAAAARRLGVDQTTVGRRLAACESALGARLFDRVDGVLRPTGAGEAAVARAAAVELEVGALEEGIAGDDAAVRGLVRVTAVPVLVNRLLVPALPALRVRHPALRVELLSEPRNVSLARREADVALRLARPDGGGPVLTRRLGRLAYAAYGPRGASAGDLPWIGYEEGLRHLPQARWIAAAAGRDGPPGLTVNDAEAILQAVRAGLGRSLLPCFVAEADARLERLGAEAVLSREVWLITHRALRHQARIAAVIDWLREAVSAAARAGPSVSRLTPPGRAPAA